MLTKAYLEPSRTSMMEFFSTLANSYFKKVLNLIELSLGSIFLHNSPFREKTYNSENFRRKCLLLTMEHFFSKFQITLWNGLINKGFLN